MHAHLARLLAVALLLAVSPQIAWADAHGEAKARYKKGLSQFALGKYTEAATEYEAAFELEPDPALLYNAAQAHRLGGNKQRALQLYQSFVRLFPKADDGTVQRHIVQLKAAIEAEGKATTAPPIDSRPPADKQPPTEPKPSAPPATPTVSTPAPSQQPATNQVVQTGPPPKKKTPAWVWGVVGGAAVVLGVALGVGLGIGLSGDVYPTATVGSQRVD